MTDLIFTERELVQSLKEYIEAEEIKLEAVKRSVFHYDSLDAWLHMNPWLIPVFRSIFSWANKLDVLTRLSTSDPEGFLAHPVNAYKLMKRLNTEWSELESLVLQNPSDGTVYQRLSQVLEGLALRKYWGLL